MSTTSMRVRNAVFGEGNAETLSSMGMVVLAREFVGKYEDAGAVEEGAHA